MLHQENRFKFHQTLNLFVTNAFIFKASQNLKKTGLKKICLAIFLKTKKKSIMRISFSDFVFIFFFFFLIFGFVILNIVKMLDQMETCSLYSPKMSFSYGESITCP